MATVKITSVNCFVEGQIHFAFSPFPLERRVEDKNSNIFFVMSPKFLWRLML